MARTPLTPSISLAERFAALAPRERKLLAAGAAAVLLFLLYLMLRGGDDSGQASVELANAPPPAPVPQPVAYAPPVMTAPAAQVAPVASVSSLVLAGVLGGGAALFAEPGGVQRVVRIGRDVVPGATLKEVGVRHVLLGTSGGDMRLEFGKSATLQAAPVAAPPVQTQSAATEQQQTLQLRLGLAPQKAGGKTIGHAIRRGADLPMLQRAGLQPGDVITGVNGSVFDEERLQELSWQIANSQRVEFDYVRGGRKSKATLGAAKQ